jgi:hypothetical protein
VAPNLRLISDNLAVIADKTCVKVENNVDEEENVDDRIQDKHHHICAVAGCPGKGGGFNQQL